MSATKGLHFMMQQYHYDMICVNQQELYNENMLKKKKKSIFNKKIILTCIGADFKATFYPYLENLI